jgi:serine/threonine-protein kinase
MKSAETLQRLDIATLKPGDVIEGRYKYIERIGRGAFGTCSDGGHGRRRAAGPEIPEPEHLPGRGDDAALRARAALQPQDHAPERHPHLRLPAHPGNYAISMEYFPSHTLGGEVLDGKPLALRRAVRSGWTSRRA